MDRIRNPVSKNQFWNLRVSLPVGWKYFREYLQENKNILGYNSMGLVTIDSWKKPEHKNIMQVSL